MKRIVIGAFLWMHTLSAHADVPPVFIQEAETIWNSNTSPKTTASFNVIAGDILVAYAITENNVSVAISDSATLTWTQQKVGSVASKTWISIWTAKVATTGAMTVTFTTSLSTAFGGNVFTFRGSSGVGASAIANAASGAPSVNITTTRANSAIVVANGDWGATDGAARAWLTNAGSLTEKSYLFYSGRYTVYGGYHANSGAIGTYAVGLTTPSQNYFIVAVEIKGSRVKHRVINY